MEHEMGTIIRVGHGRGFVIQGIWNECLVLTAAHCLPRLPPPQAASFEGTYKELLGPLDAEPSVWCDCLFVDPVADIAVLGSPDDQVLSAEALKYQALMETAKCFTIAAPPSKPIPNPALDKLELSEEERKPHTDYECPAFMYGLDGKRIPCTVRHRSWGQLILTDSEKLIGGMSGSPIVDTEGNAIGMSCLASGSGTGFSASNNPLLVNNLPGWLVRAHAENASAGRFSAA
jgi:hypothetical protein